MSHSTVVQCIIGMAPVVQHYVHVYINFHIQLAVIWTSIILHQHMKICRVIEFSDILPCNV